MRLQSKIMTNFFYRAVDALGKQRTGEQEAEDKFSLARLLRAEGLTVIAVEDALARRNKAKFSLSWRRRVSLRDKIIFANNLSAMLSAGLSLSRALSVLERQTENKFFSRTIGLMVKAINKGSSFSQSLVEQKKIFPEVFVAMVETAEESGKLPETLKLVANQLEKTYGLQRKIIGALIYTAIIVLVIIAIAVLMMIFLVPTLSATFKELGVPLPLSTRVVIGTSDFLVNNLPLVGAIVLFIVSLATFFLRTKSGQIKTARLTIASARFPDSVTTNTSITINQDLEYTYFDGQDTLALIAQNNINVGLKSEDDLEIRGALVAKNGRVGRFYYNSACGSEYKRENLNLFGLIATNVRYGFAYVDGTGYANRYLNYDGNLLYGPPPSFPLTSDQYETISWREL